MPAWLRAFQLYGVTVLLIGLGAGLRIWPLAQLGVRIPWLTFYPVITVAALYGGFRAGVLGTGLSGLVVIFGWPWLAGQPYLRDQADWVGAAVFGLNCLIISGAGWAMRRAQAQARQAQAQAEAANRAKSVFLANMSHELRTPLNAVLGFSRLLRQSAATSPEQATSLEIIIRSAEHLLDLINNVLDIAKIESGRVSLEEAETDLRELTQDVQALLTVRAREKGLALELVWETDAPRQARTDPGKLRQVLINLIGNAIKYTPHGTIRVTVRAAGPARLRFEVADTGPGVAPADRDRLFKPFVQLGGRPTTEAGSGLGLAICKQNIELLGGIIDVTAAPGGGALFFFEIPVTVLAAATPAAPRPAGRVIGLAAGQPRRRLLIAEDQPENRLLLRQLLEPLGFELREAVNGQEAVDLCAAWQPDLVWMDIRMPGLNGLEATRLIRADPGGRSIKIVALTAHALEDERREILAAGCDDFIRKPYQEREIFDVLSRHLALQFVYAAPAAAPAASAFVRTAELQPLPAALRQELAQAVELLDEVRCLAVLDRVALIDRALADRLRGELQAWRYDLVLEALDHAAGERAVGERAAQETGG